MQKATEIKKTVQLQYFASLREKANKKQELFPTNASTLEELYQDVCERYQISLPVEHVRVSVNEEFSAMDSPVREGDRIAFLPPVAGG